MIVLGTILGGLALLTVQIVAEEIDRVASVEDGPWVPQPRCKYQPHPRWRVIRKG